MSQRVLLTGALGFIGSHVAEALIARGDEVVGVDDLSGNVVDHIDGMTCLRTDARDVWRRNPHSFDLVIHAASPVGPVALLRRSSIVAEIIETTQAVIRFCEQRNIPLVNISSSEVYGFSGVYRETDPCVIPHVLSHRIQYAAGKLAAEHLVRTCRTPTLSIRPFNVAGPRQSRAKGFVIPTFCEQALAGDPLTVFDGGSQERCPTAVWDVVDFLLAAEPSMEHPVVNVGNARNRTTVMGLAGLIIKATGTSSRVEFTSGKKVHGPEYEEAVGRVKVPDAEVAGSMGWEPRVGLQELVERTLADIEASSARQAA
jgi:nucleoside-diphosphate-sugar epimerase